ncbi:MAG: hypothetical protein M1326_05175 [Cyanobacteria bacterium]|nr:hypothetical protein [Cyanobacteriota bacterium]MCL5674536.1 hypothetical protein [Candidatus Omnitrophota bacterium]
MYFLNFETLVFDKPWFVWIFLIIINILIVFINKLYYHKKASIYGYKKAVQEIPRKTGYLRNTIKFIIIVSIFIFLFPNVTNFHLWILGCWYFGLIAILIYNIIILISTIQFFNLFKNDSRYALFPSFPPSLIFVWFALFIGFTYLIKSSLFLLGGFFILCIFGMIDLFRYIDFFRKFKGGESGSKKIYRKFLIGIFWIIGIIILGFMCFLIFGEFFLKFAYIIHFNKNKLTNRDLERITYGNHKFVVVGDNGTILISTDGIHWTKDNSETTNNLKEITYGNNKFIAVGNNGTILTSTDGIHWTKQNSGTFEDISIITYGNKKFVAAVGYPPGVILTSFDGIRWISYHLKVEATEFNGICYGNNIFVIIGSKWLHGIIYISTDAKTWIVQHFKTIENLSGITHEDKKFVTVGNNGTILTSSNGKKWIKENSRTTENIEGIIYGNNEFVVVGLYGTILISSDGIHWTKQNSETTHNLLGITYGNKKFVAVGGNGTILTSPDGKTWTLHRINR